FNFYDFSFALKPIDFYLSISDTESNEIKSMLTEIVRYAQQEQLIQPILSRYLNKSDTKNESN
ncbi:MAG: hypothetical protein OXT67_12835, partial [Zetaproteobacteria bacterium]|nr:hypothetical protein [Zetaproteobacteria bacterium]